MNIWILHHYYYDENSNLCTKFSQFFVDKIDVLKRAVAKKTMATSPSERTHIGQLLKTLSPVTPEEVDTIIMSIPAKSSHLDFIPTYLIKDIHFTFSDIIARLTNLSFTEGMFPNGYKSAIVTPILKKPNFDRDDSAKYRPITNISPQSFKRSRQNFVYIGIFLL